MNNILTLESKLKELKLTKRSFLLEGKSTEEIDVLINEVEEKLKEINCNTEE